MKNLMLLIALVGAAAPAQAITLTPVEISAIQTGGLGTYVPQTFPIQTIPASFPSRPIDVPSIDSPLVRLPSPVIPIPSLPGDVVRVETVRMASAVKTVVVLQKSFAGKDGSAPSISRLNARIDNAKVEKTEAADDAEPVKVPAKRRQGDKPELTLPEYDLLREIGLPR